jgi:hypothetical protein
VLTDLIAVRLKHWPDLLRAGISIREGRLSSVTLLRRLGNHSRRNRLYKALRELGRVIRTITLLRYLSEPGLRDQIGAITNRTEKFHNFAQFLMIGGRLIGHNDPDYQERVVKFNELVANAAIFSTALDITDAANARPPSPRTSRARYAVSAAGSSISPARPCPGDPPRSGAARPVSSLSEATKLQEGVSSWIESSCLKNLKGIKGAVCKTVGSSRRAFGRPQTRPHCQIRPL